MRRTLYILATGIFGIATTEFSVIGILPQIAERFNITIDKTGLLLSSFAIIIAIFAPFMMLLASSFDRKKLMLLVLAVFTISNILSGFSVSFNMLLLARMLPAFLHPIFWSIALSTAAGSVPKEQSPAAVSIVFGGFTIASVLGVPLATFMTSLFNWQASFILCAIINLISFSAMLILLPELPAIEKQPQGAQRTILRKPVLWINLILACLMIAGMYSTYGYIAVFLEKVTRMNNIEISLMLLIFGFTGIGGNYFAGKFLSKNITKTTFAFIIALSLIHILLYFEGSQFAPMIIVTGLWGFIHTAGFLISNVNVTSAASEAPEFVNSIFTSCGNLAVTLGTAIGGLCIAHFHIRIVIWSSVILLVLSAIVLVIKQYTKFST
ncbi:hypothetical protein TH53_05120 [Pedobacter lusitanus]|uniref:Major facilitator superfamily (MFS) profile domain-containing protein n=1 Tax=Pedobacter lusitanus TaxID=1503925 RepID=A0A0D0GLR7_9SPHI|nr:MFS transporter [Pedobacter lusitanus]KIO78187.1 hypothetical protein TH53_05120 [Pedobacter lusitanus]